MSGDRAIDYGEAAASQPAEKALGYGEAAARDPAAGRGAAASKQATQPPGDAEDGDNLPPPEAEGFHPPDVIARFNTLALDLSLLDRNRIPEVTGVEHLIKTARDRYRSILLARIIHAVGQPALSAAAINLPLWLRNRGQGGPGLPAHTSLVLGERQADDFGDYDATAAFELLRQLAAAADAAPGSRWETGWNRMTPALDALFGPGVTGNRLLGGSIDRPCDDIFGIVGAASTASEPGSARVRSAIVSAMDNGTIADLQGLTKYNDSLELRDLLRPDRLRDARDAQNVFWRADAYHSDLNTLARLMADIVPAFDSLRYARVVGVQQSFLLLLLFLDENHLADVLPHAIEQTAYVLASQADHSPELLDECGVRMGFIVGAIQSALVQTMDSPRNYSNATTTVGALASLLSSAPKVPTPISLAVTFLSAAASYTVGAIDEHRASRARSERDTALANVGVLADAEAARVIAKDRRAGRFIGMRLAGTNEARRAFGLPTM